MGLKVRKPYVIAESKNHAFIWLGLDASEMEQGILTNQYLVIDHGEAMVVDPGGHYVFERVYSNVCEFVPPEKVKAVFFSHQDPDVVGSLVLVTEFFPNAVVYVSRLWTRFLPHLGVSKGVEIVEVPDSGAEIEVGKSRLRAIPAHYLHSPGNFTLYDPVVRVLYSADIGAAIFPRGVWYLFVENFEEHAKLMEWFHRRFLASRRALLKWISIVKRLDIEIVAPQHGAIFVGEHARRFLEWLESLEGVGIDNE